MQQNKTNSKDQLRQPENQQIPDLNHKNEHWQQEQTIQKPKDPELNPSISKSWLWMIAAVCLIGAAVLIVNRSQKKEDKISFTENKIVKPEAKTVTDTTGPVGQINLSRLTVKDQLISGDDSHASVLENKIFKDTFSVNDNADKNLAVNTTILTREDQQNMLKDLLIQVRKKGELFTIDNTRDTVIKAREGSVIVIPVNAFDTKSPVVVEVREFYKYSDMVADGLTTLSDGRQLVTGGMVYLSAKVNDKEVLVQPGKEIRVFIPNITAADSMEIFEGVKNAGIDRVDNGDLSMQSQINWQLTKVRIDSPVFKMFIRAIDLKDDLIEYTTTYNWKTKAVFFRATKSVYSKEELQVILQKKYGDYYDKIRVRRQWERNLLFQKVEREEVEYTDVAYNSLGVGDTAELLPISIKIYKLNPIDTVYKIVRWIKTGYREIRKTIFPSTILSGIGEKYSIGLSKLGWVNCDRFYNYAGKKSDFVIDLKDSSFNYVSYLVFENFKSIMQAEERGNYSVFQNVPMGEPVKIITIGVRDGKTVTAVKSTITTGSILSDLSFESASPTELKSTFSKIDK